MKIHRMAVWFFFVSINQVIKFKFQQKKRCINISLWTKWEARLKIV